MLAGLGAPVRAEAEKNALTEWEAAKPTMALDAALESKQLSVSDFIDATENQSIGQPNAVDRNRLDQVTSVSQFSDVQPTDWAFQALQSLVERYGCIAGYPDGTYRGN
ncbi:MAG: S-layer homology domain-containing protein, partial [Cyanobacteria bacterium SID2]|nr:S-layer homology domain-containing protein [Cyanobacteria bacterium SID2]